MAWPAVLPPTGAQHLPAVPPLQLRFGVQAGGSAPTRPPSPRCEDAAAAYRGAPTWCSRGCAHGTGWGTGSQSPTWRPGGGTVLRCRSRWGASGEVTPAAAPRPGAPPPSTCETAKRGPTQREHAGEEGALQTQATRRQTTCRRGVCLANASRQATNHRAIPCAGSSGGSTMSCSMERHRQRSM
jgi:hypothetical protein